MRIKDALLSDSALSAALQFTLKVVSNSENTYIFKIFKLKIENILINQRILIFHVSSWERRRQLEVKTDGSPEHLN